MWENIEIERVTFYILIKYSKHNMLHFVVCDIYIDKMFIWQDCIDRFRNFYISLNNTRKITINNLKKLAFQRKKLYETYIIIFEKVVS